MHSRPVCRWLLMTLLCLPAVQARAEGASESALKAAFLYYFVLYTEWPVLPPAFDICLLGTSNLQSALTPLARKEIAGRPLRIRQLDDQQPDSTGCSLLFITPSDAERMADLVRTAAGKPMLTVAESGRYNPDLIMLRISNEQGILGFDANVTAARAAGLRFSAKLLRLARKTQ